MAFDVGVICASVSAVGLGPLIVQAALITGHGILGEIHGEIHCLILKFIRRLLGFIDSRCLANSCFSISGNFIYFKDGIFPLWEDVFVWKTCGQCPTPGLLVLGLTIYTFRPLATGSKCRNFHKTKSVETRRKVITLR